MGELYAGGCELGMERSGDGKMRGWGDGEIRANFILYSSTLLPSW